MSTSLRSLFLGVLATVLLLAVGAVAFVWSGRYDIGADAPHTRPVFALMQALRERSIRAHAADLVVPDLADPQLVLKGAGQYAAMCTQCHLSPAMAESEIHPGLYPQPPNLSRMRVDPKQAFWVIKHGIKMSAMPAWGASHDDATIWSMVAFLQQLPGMSAQEYKDIVARAPPDDDMDMDAATNADHHYHDHDHDHDHGGHDHDGAPAAH
ncbi:cytochrome c [Dyella sp.]|jgi:mono/diheme cytochrome c family protein|uniref:c-type cytochrome n=1 Tax=Dyella sp. TaxID=1869338 RepID=UPI002D795C27|nr:cytochrome c [Dyella sp.]HET6434038.1 cytochrome c [Dyella sp.]